MKLNPTHDQTTIRAAMNISAKDFRGKHAYQALGRLKAGKMNKTEAKYAAYLEGLKQAGEVLWYAFEPANLRLADGCFYRVDFLVLTKENALEAREVKGFWTDDAKVKIKVAADKFPFRFVAIQLVKGQWVEQEF